MREGRACNANPASAGYRNGSAHKLEVDCNGVRDDLIVFLIYPVNKVGSSSNHKIIRVGIERTLGQSIISTRNHEEESNCGGSGHQVHLSAVADIYMKR